MPLEFPVASPPGSERHQAQEEGIVVQWPDANQPKRAGESKSSDEILAARESQSTLIALPGGRSGPPGRLSVKVPQFVTLA